LSALGALTSNSPWLSISSPITLGVLNAVTGTANATFEVTVSNDAPQVVMASFEYVVNAGNYAAQKSFGPYTINAILETFETQNFDTYPWDMNGNKPWFITPTSAYTGAYSSRSGVITHNQQSEMSLTLDFSVDGTLSFARRVSSEQDYDFLRFLIDDVEIDAWSGLVPWGEVSYPLTAGIHKITWIYQKDAIGNSNSDRAWVDDISLPPHVVLVGTNQPQQADFKLSLSPNPTSNKVWLQWETPTAQRMDIAVLDCMGRQVQTYTSAGTRLQGAHNLELNVQDLASGLYFVQLLGETGTQVLKLVKE
jgi:hypothetical protein